jgi:Fe2+ transport system protein FeoA
MNMEPIICPLCGTAFELNDESNCAACPLHNACVMICCPTCGYTMASPERSSLARGVMRLARTLRHLLPSNVAAPLNRRHTLADAPVGVDLQIISCSTLAREHHDWLQAYGVQPGHCVRVLQHRPVTIVQVAQVELALESAIAQAVQVEAIGVSASATHQAL